MMMMMMKRRVEQDKRERERVAIVHNVKVMLLIDKEVSKSALDLTLPHCCIHLAVHRCETPRPLVPPIFDC